jgi:hypothetical protein
VEARYSQQSDAVRRVPVAMKMVIDQDYLEDLMTAVANSRLRIQITQVEWKHFPRGTSIAPPLQDEEGQTERNPSPKTKTTGPGGGGKTMPSMMTMMNQPGAATGQTATSAPSSDELSANLLEVAIYGVAAIYEHYTPTKAE